MAALPNLMSSLTPIIVYGQGGPNPIPLVCNELGIPFEIVPNFSFSQTKSPEFLAINPNGRMPAIVDPNTNITLWESGAIIEYLVDTYDKDYKISFLPGTPEYFMPSSGYSSRRRARALTSGNIVIERYLREINRVTGVLDTQLEKKSSNNGSAWLVGDKCSYADLAFVPWQSIALARIGTQELNIAHYPNVAKWLNEMKQRRSVKECLAAMELGD